MSRKLLSILLIGMLVLTGCGKEEKETQEQLSVSEEENKVKYEVSELSMRFRRKMRREAIMLEMIFRGLLVTRRGNRRCITVLFRLRMRNIRLL